MNHLPPDVVLMEDRGRWPALELQLRKPWLNALRPQSDS
jgi:hypothetical protein